MHLKPRVHFTGGDGIGWALDEDLRLTREAAKNFVQETELSSAEIIHSAWWEAFRHLSSELDGKKIICHLTGSLFRYLSIPEFTKTLPKITHWIARSNEGLEQLKSLGITAHYLPYIVDTNIFKETLNAAKELQIKIGNSYLIGNFHRDTEGKDLITPKPDKGPDLFLEIVKNLHQQNLPIHVILGGPRRHWLINKLKKYQIPFTYFGKENKSDDLFTNLLNRTTLNLLYNILDVYIISSRSEGGPHSVLEAAAANCNVISTRVGHCPDILEPECLYETADEASAIIKKDIEIKFLNNFKFIHKNKIKKNHSPATAQIIVQKIYSSLEDKTYSYKSTTKKTKTNKISIWHNFVPPPWGGGNQFLLALKKEIEKRGISVVENIISENIHSYLVNSVHFDIEKFKKEKNSNTRIIHRIDGPIRLSRGTEDAAKLDQLCFSINKELASYTVLQSAWTLKAISKEGYQPINPVVIKNAVDPSIFNTINKTIFETNRKIRLISTSWSNNIRKGGAHHKWIEDNLDWSKFEYTFVGNTSEKLIKANHLPAVDSLTLSGILKQHDIYIMCSETESCSNAVLEALACGLPVIYNKKAANNEIVGFAGIGYESINEIFPAINRIINNYDNFRNTIHIPNIKDVADKYLELLFS